MMLTVWTALMVLLVACGGDGNGNGNGNDDTLLTGFSGVVILALAVFLVVRAMKKRG